ncbi:MAG: strawberry notch family protein, partial [Prevotellaceae bacterium]|nr:strawberry notch family protein [Prevotellaceae bacterium]
MKLIQILNQFFTIKGENGTKFCVAADSDRNNNVTQVEYISVQSTKKLPADWQSLKKRHSTTAISKIQPVEFKNIDGLGMAYRAAATAVDVLNTVVPDSMGEEMHNALKSLTKAVDDVSGFVCERLQFSREQLAERLAAEQVDAIAMAIYNIEMRNQGFIVGDQTGVGKGRIAAAMVRYAIVQGYTPVFITEKPNLFTDFYRDLADIGCADYKPFIINAKESKSVIKDKNGATLFEPDDVKIQNDIFEKGFIPKGYNFVMATYSQFSDKDFTLKKQFLHKIATDNIIILDEAHNAGGSVGVMKGGKQVGGSNTATFFVDVVKRTKGVVFLSATFAKRPDNMPLYSVKTSIGETSLPADKLVEAITKGGVALQEVLSSNIVKEGQMVRREKSKDQITVNYITLDKEGKARFGVPDCEKSHRQNLDIVTELIRDIIDFQEKYVSPVIKNLDEISSAQNVFTEQRRGTAKLGVDNQAFASRTFQIINQLLFSLKCREVAQRAVWNMQNGRKTVIAFANTMEAMLVNLGVDVGDVINIDYSASLILGLDSTLRITEIGDDGIGREKRSLSLDELGEEGAKFYAFLKQKIRKSTSNIIISPIDLMKDIIDRAGFSVAEVTGRKYQVKFNEDYTKGTIDSRKKENIADAFRKFQNNEIDCLFINTSGSTGASAHAIPTNSVKAEDVKQRVMIIAQPELNISTEVQKRGRIDRTGQIYPPIYEYISSAIPAEKRFMMMLQKKLKSLDANTTSNQKQSKNVVEYDDFLNKYGDDVVTQFLNEDTELKRKLGYKNDDDEKMDDKIQIHQATGRVALLSTAEQEEFYNTMLERYKSYVDFKIQAGEYDLEMETENLQAETLEKRLTMAAKGTGKSVFSQPTYEEVCMVNVLKKPFTEKELLDRIKTAQKDTDNDKIRENFKNYLVQKQKESVEKINEKWRLVTKNIPNERKYVASENKAEYMKQRAEEIVEAREKDIARESDKNNSQWCSISPLISAFTPASVWNFGTWGAYDGMTLPCVCLGININTKSRNPFAPSNIEVAFAVADSTRFFKFNCANEQRQYLQLIKSAPSWNIDRQAVENWNEITKQRTANREQRVIITGNILQAFDKEEYAKGGKLISFTRKNGDVEKGIFIRRVAGEKLTELNTRRIASVTVPIEKAKGFILNAPRSIYLQCSLKFYIIRYNNNKFKILTMGGSKQDFAPIITNPRLIELADNDNGFILSRSQWDADFDEKDMPAVIDELATMGVNIRIEGAAAEGLQKQLENGGTESNWKKLSWNKSNIPAGTNPRVQSKRNDAERLRIVEAEMLMMEMELELEMEMKEQKTTKSTIFSEKEGLNGYVQTEILSVKNLYPTSIDTQKLKNAYKKFVGTSVRNLEQNIEIEFIDDGLNKSVFGRKDKLGFPLFLNSTIATAIHYLPDLLEYAEFSS